MFRNMSIFESGARRAVSSFFGVKDDELDEGWLNVVLDDEDVPNDDDVPNEEDEDVLALELLKFSSFVAEI